jgi:hypothetical protein
MLQASLMPLVVFTLAPPSLPFTHNTLEIHENAAAANRRVQPGLSLHELIPLETSTVAAMGANLTSGMLAESDPPPPLVMTKSWQCNGKIKGLFKVKASRADNDLLAASIRWVISRPELQEHQEVFFTHYQVNQPTPEDIQTRLDSQ